MTNLGSSKILRSIRNVKDKQREVVHLCEINSFPSCLLTSVLNTGIYVDKNKLLEQEFLLGSPYDSKFTPIGMHLFTLVMTDLSTLL